MNFDLAHTPIERGSTLIEASAGTGKTFTIAGIFLRLIVEENFTVDKILVVTFTEAATAELRDRVRRILSMAAVAFRTGKSDVPYIQALVDRSPGRAAMVERLDRAIRDFDQSAIFTIHGFCQRALREHAFESGILFDTELITDQSQLVQETIEDFWRKRFYTDNSVLLHFALRYKSSPEAFAALARSCLNQAPSRIVGRAAELDAQEIGEKIIALFKKVKRTWCLNKPEIIAPFHDLSWATRPLNGEGVAKRHLDNVALCLENDQITADGLAWTGALCTSGLAGCTRKKSTPPEHPFFTLCEELRALEQDYVAALEFDCITFVQEELARRKRQQNVQSFQDLLTNLRDALRTKRGEALAASLRRKYQAALIDEFQDTDPLQYEIFQRVFASDENFLFLIGDPKQAIYGFRGADIFTYLKAAQSTARRYSLPTNFRSQSGLVHAVNTLFQAGQDPFLFSEIAFQPVQADGKADAEPLILSGKQPAPLEFWLWDDPNLPATKTNAERILPRKVAAEISRLLAGDLKLGERRAKPSDFAVLVLENHQARLMQQALREFNIPSVLHTNESLFATPEATEFHRLLLAAAEPTNERLLRAALATDMFGLKAEELEALNHDETQWQGHLQQFREYHEQWVAGGFIQMFRLMLIDQQVRQRLLSFPDGERRLTNVLHLSEVLHQATIERQLGPAGLLKWLNDQMGAEGEPAEENQLRLESDENAVQLVTVHKSKGLEYPIVFCPFSWKPAKMRLADRNLAWYHEGDAIALDLGSEQLAIHQEAQLRENLAEKMRLLYVAVTRARNRCYVVWGKFRDAGHSALAYLLHQPTEHDGDLFQATAERFDQISDHEFALGLAKVASASRLSCGTQTIGISGLPGEAAIRYSTTEVIEAPRVQNFTGEIDSNWEVTSFSSLRTGSSWEIVDIEALEERNSLKPSRHAAPLFPSNIRAGICIHSIFQALDFTDESEIEPLVKTQLEHAGFGEEYHEVVGQMAKNALGVQLPEVGSLSTIERKDRLDEMEFYFPLNQITHEQIDALLRKHDVAGIESNPPAQIGRLTFEPVKGFMRGYIDSIIRKEGKYYVIDWKTNWLGNKPDDYDSAGMREALLSHHYHLQYHIYTLALHRYLQNRLPGYSYDEHFGGVYYIFLRGVDPARAHLGVFNDRPSADLLAEFEELLLPPPC